MQNHRRIALFEAALRAMLATRCERAYRHDLKNSLQAIHAGMEVLIRTISIGSDKPAERVIAFAKNAVTQHTTTIESLFNTVIAAEAPTAAIDVNTLIQKCALLLRQDAFEHSVKIELQLCAAANVQLVIVKMHIVLLALITDAIDALSRGGHIQITTRIQDKQVVIEVQDSRPTSADVAWAEPLPDFNIDDDVNVTSLRATLLPTVVRNLVEADRGRVEHHLNASGRSVWITMPEAATTSS